MEHWKPVPGYESLYSVSNLGRVRIDIKRHNIRKGSMLSQSPQKGGYLYVSLRRDSELRPKRHHVARLVLTAFVSDPKANEQANHNNGNVTDNRLSNLEWMTPAKNTEHSISVLGFSREGEKNPSAKLTKRKVVRLRELAASGMTYTALGKKFGVTNAMVCAIARGKAWRNAGGPITESKPKGRPRRAN